MTTSLSPSPSLSAVEPRAVPAESLVAVVDLAGARRWFGLAVGSLVLAGALALFLVVGRVPPLDQLFDDPLVFRRGLVVHVVLALVVWFFAFIGGLWRLLPASGRVAWRTHAGHAVAVLGVVAMVAATVWPGSAPVLSNYVPMIDNPLFVGGVLAFGLGLVLALVDQRLVVSHEHDAPGGAPPLVSPAARPALRAAAVAVLIAVLTFAASTWTTPSQLPAEPYFERVVWGGGHVLQFASSAAMCAVWLMLLTPALGRSPLSRPVMAIVFGLFTLPLMAAPLMADTQDPGSRTFFTRLMELAIFPAVSIVLVASVVAIVRAARRGERHLLRDRRVLGFGASALLTLLGFALGASIDGSNTMVPAHYHASIGAVTAAFMTLAYDLFVPLGLGAPGPRTTWLARWQPLAFGLGQMVFAVGFGIGGAHGLARKTYGTEQIADDAGRTVGLVVMGLGGLVAVAAGLTFLTVCISAWRRRARTEPPFPSAPTTTRSLV